MAELRRATESAENAAKEVGTEEKEQDQEQEYLDIHPSTDLFADHEPAKGQDNKEEIPPSAEKNKNNNNVKPKPKKESKDSKDTKKDSEEQDKPKQKDPKEKASEEAKKKKKEEPESDKRKVCFFPGSSKAARAATEERDCQLNVHEILKEFLEGSAGGVQDNTLYQLFLKLGKSKIGPKGPHLIVGARKIKKTSTLDKMLPMRITMDSPGTKQRIIRAATLGDLWGFKKNRHSSANS